MSASYDRGFEDGKEEAWRTAGAPYERFILSSEYRCGWADGFEAGMVEQGMDPGRLDDWR